MIVKKYINNELAKLNRLYRKSKTNDEQNFFGKLALLEVCGWIEQTMDDIFKSISNKKIKRKPTMNHINNILHKNFGFSYESHFLKLLNHVIGAITIEKMCRQCGNVIALGLDESITDPRLSEICNIIGKPMAEKISKKVELEIGTVGFSKFKTALNNLKKIRDDYAHTHIRATKTPIYAPSWILPHFTDIYIGLKSFQKHIK